MGVTVVAIVALALFLRSYWNLDVAHGADGFVLSGGSDPYYHKRAIDCIVDGGCSSSQPGPWSHHLKDPLLNYPFGSINPNPPLYQWTTALAGAALDPVLPGGQSDAVWWATIWSPAVWGSLTVVPLYFLGAHLWSRKAGLLGAFFWAISTSAIDQTALGDADHDAIVLFFIVTSTLFYTKMLTALRGTEIWVGSWASGASISAGVGRLLRERRVAFAYAGLSGMGLAAVALTWKGFPYLIGIVLGFASLMLVIDHWRNRDASGLFLGTTLVFLLGVGLALPYYITANLIAANMYSVFVMLGAWALVGLVLVPTRDLPTVLVIPGFAVIGALGALGVYTLFPAVWRSLFLATVYFRQSTLYQTIAEAHPADFNQMVFGIGPVVFLLSIVAIGWLAWSLRKETTRSRFFILVWAIVALYMAQAAVRFLFNATPVLTLLAGAFTARILEWLDFGRVRREIAGSGSIWGGMRRGVGPLHVVSAILLAFLLVAPQVVLAFDAAVPARIENDWQTQRLRDWLKENGYTDAELAGKAVDGQDGLRELYIKKRLEQKDQEDTAENRLAISREFIFFVERRMGAFGQSFLDPSWQRSLAFLDKYNAENYSGPAENRPAFLAWWDYGHWAISVGHTPAVADNFQNGYQFAANFLLSQNETHAIQLLAARLLPLLDAPARLATVQKAAPSATESTVADLLAWRYVNLTEEQSVKLVAEAEAATGKRIRFFTTDSRMMPLDDPNTRTIDRNSIYYAPVILKGDPAEKYLVTKYSFPGEVREYSSDELEKRLSDPGQPRPTQNPSQKLEYKQPFFNSMFYRGFVGPSPSSAVTVDANTVLTSYFRTILPGFGLKHFRAIYSDADVRILEYYPGANLTGRVVDAAGNPVANADVAVFDDVNGASRGVFHGSAKTDAQGRYSILAPFSTHQGVFVEATKDGVRVANQTVRVSHEAAATGAAVAAPDLRVLEGTVEGTIYLDTNANGQREAANETANLTGLEIKVGDRAVTVGANNTFTVKALAGVANVTTDNTTFVFPTGATLTIEPNKTVARETRVLFRSVNLTGDLTLDDLGNVNLTGTPPRLRFGPDPAVAGNTAQTTSATVGFDGAYTVLLSPGTYKVTLVSDYTHKDSEGNDAATYSLPETSLVVAPGQGAVTRAFVLERQAT